MDSKGQLKVNFLSSKKLLDLISYLEHEKCYRTGIVQRAVSVNNIIISNGEGHLIDFDHAKFTGRFKSVANGVPERIEEDLRKPLLRKFDEAVISRDGGQSWQGQHLFECLS